MFFFFPSLLFNLSVFYTHQLEEFYYIHLLKERGDILILSLCMNLHNITTKNLG